MCCLWAPAHARIPNAVLTPGKRSFVVAVATEPRPTTATRTNGVPARRICRFGPVSLRAVSYNRNCSTPSARSRFRDDNCGANVRLSLTRDRNIFPNRDALLQGAGHKNKFPPTAPRLCCSRVPSACRTSTRRQRLIRDPRSDPRLPWPTRPRARLSPVPSPNNAL